MKCSIEMLQKGAIKKNPIPYPMFYISLVLYTHKLQFSESRFSEILSLVN